MKGLVVLLVAVWAAVPASADEEERLWDQRKAKKMVSLVLEVEKAETRPWSAISWRKTPGGAAVESKRTGKPLFVFFYEKLGGDSAEPCCPGGRLIRAGVLSDPKVQSLIKSRYIPVKVPIEPGTEFPLDWHALASSAEAFRFTDGKGFAGCSVVSCDLEIEYANSGSAKIWELFESTAYDAGRFVAMLDRAKSRHAEERSLRAQRGLTTLERKKEVTRFRRGIQKAVKSEATLRLPPKGFSLQLAMELFAMLDAEG